MANKAVGNIKIEGAHIMLGTLEERRPSTIVLEIETSAYLSKMTWMLSSYQMMDGM